MDAGLLTRTALAALLLLAASSPVCARPQEASQYNLADNAAYVDVGALLEIGRVQTMATIKSEQSRFNLFCEQERLWATIIGVVPSDEARLLFRFTLNDPALSHWDGAIARRFLVFADNGRYIVKTDDLSPDLYNTLYDAESLKVTSTSLGEPLFSAPFTDEERLAIRQVIRDCTPPME